jgi:hypothetical protein
MCCHAISSVSECREQCRHSPLDLGALNRMEIEKKIIFAQAIVRGWLVRRKFKALATTVKKRERTIRELLETEKYVYVCV